MSGLDSIGMTYIVPSGTYFLLGNVDTLEGKFNPEGFGSGTRDYQMARWMYEVVGVGVIPPSAFYSESHAYLGEKYLRFSFCRTPESIQRAVDTLRKFNQ